MRGAWIEIFLLSFHFALVARRSPCGERGLKCVEIFGAPESALSLPVRGAWIEINQAPPHGGGSPESLPVRGAWIEMRLLNLTPEEIKVAPRAGSVD